MTRADLSPRLAPTGTPVFGTTRRAPSHNGLDASWVFVPTSRSRSARLHAYREPHLPDCSPCCSSPLVSAARGSAERQLLWRVTISYDGGSIRIRGPRPVRNSANRRTLTRNVECLLRRSGDTHRCHLLIRNTLSRWRHGFKSRWDYLHRWSWRRTVPPGDDRLVGTSARCDLVAPASLTAPAGVAGMTSCGC